MTYSNLYPLPGHAGMYTFQPVRRLVKDWHQFFQDPKEQARLCDICGYWPEHHNHAPVNDCICQECQPTAERFREEPTYSYADRMEVHYE